jgi:hypothetical protein
MIKLDENLLVELGLGSLPKPEKTAFLKHMYETLEMRVGTRLAERMSDQQMTEFEQFINSNDEQGAFHWLEGNFPNYKEVVAEEFEKLKGEIRPLAGQIVAASQAQAQSQPGGAQPVPASVQPPAPQDPSAQSFAPAPPQPQPQPPAFGQTGPMPANDFQSPSAAAYGSAGFGQPMQSVQQQPVAPQGPAYTSSQQSGFDQPSAPSAGSDPSSLGSQPFGPAAAPSFDQPAQSQPQPYPTPPQAPPHQYGPQQQPAGQQPNPFSGPTPSFGQPGHGQQPPTFGGPSPSPTPPPVQPPSPFDPPPQAPPAQ